MPSQGSDIKCPRQCYTSANMFGLYSYNYMPSKIELGWFNDPFFSSGLKPGTGLVFASQFWGVPRPVPKIESLHQSNNTCFHQIPSSHLRGLHQDYQHNPADGRDIELLGLAWTHRCWSLMVVFGRQAVKTSILEDDSRCIWCGETDRMQHLGMHKLGIARHTCLIRGLKGWNLKRGW